MSHAYCQCAACRLERFLNHSWPGMLVGLLAILAVPVLALFVH